MRNIFCRHEWEEVKNTRHMIQMGMSKGAIFKCLRCGKEKWMDIFNVPKNKYVFKEYSKGDISDGSHTFDELYYHRMILFTVICNTYKQKAWKSWLHEDGTMYDEYFIVGISTPNGDYSYHYHRDYWGEFDVPELCRAPKWDGHRPSDIGRLHSLVGSGNLVDLVEWLKGEKYINVDEKSDIMTDTFEKQHLFELSRNIMINKTIRKIKEMMIG